MTPTIQSSLGIRRLGGIRAYLDSRGIDYALTFIGEVLGDVSGGVKRGATYEGWLDATFIDRGKGNRRSFSFFGVQLVTLLDSGDSIRTL